MIPSSEFAILKDDATIIDPDVNATINQEKSRISISDDMKNKENGRRKRWEKFASSSESGNYHNYGYVKRL